jgi:hypothetical protein
MPEDQDQTQAEDYSDQLRGWWEHRPYPLDLAERLEKVDKETWQALSEFLQRQRGRCLSILQSSQPGEGRDLFTDTMISMRGSLNTMDLIEQLPSQAHDDLEKYRYEVRQAEGLEPIGEEED